MLAGSLLLSWFFFDLLSRKLASVPDEFHLDTLWGKVNTAASGDDQ